MVCFKCGYINNDDSVYCWKCGCNIMESGLKYTQADISDDKTESSNYGVDAEKNQEKIRQPDVESEVSGYNAASEERRLARLVTELRNENKQAVSRNEWYTYAAMTAIPVAGAVFFALNKEKNINKSNYARAGLVVNAVISLIMALCIIVALCTSAGHKNAAQQDYIEMTNAEQESEGTPVQPFVFDRQSNQISFELNGISFNYPLSAQALVQSGFTYDTQTMSPFSMTKVTAAYTDSYNSTVLITYDSEKGEESACENLAVKFSSDTSFLGLTQKSDYGAVTEIFKNADSQESAEYDASTSTGTVYFKFGSYEIGVSLKNNAVSSAVIKG